jgi:DNA-binding response OmpR family regulator
MSGRVLLVDDDPSVRRSLSTVLQRAGFEVTTAEDALPAMELNSATGDQVVRHFKSRGRVWCAVLTGQDDELTAARCREAGADAVMQKPATPSVLRRCLADGLSALRDAA